MTERLLTKTILMKGFQCPKQFYLYLNSPELAEEDTNKEKTKREGSIVGEMAQALYPMGVLIKDRNPYQALEETKEKFNNPILFEPAFFFEQLYFRADIFQQEADGVSIIEIKASSEVKDYQLEDLGIQAYILTKLGYKIKKLVIAHINNTYTTDAPLEQFFVHEDMTQEVLNLLPEIESKILKLRDCVKAQPQVEIGPQCNKPFECPFSNYCYKKAGVTENNVLNFSISNRWDLYRSGKTDMFQLTPEDMKTDKQRELLRKLQSNEWIDEQAVRDVFNTWAFPLYFLDFETMGSIFPKYPNAKPNAQIPYQFSLFLLEDPGKRAVRTQAYVAESLDKDPRFELAKALVESCGKSGSIVSYFASFEKGRIIEMAKLIPALHDDLMKIHDRIVDLFPVMKNHVYYRKFAGSWSIKSVIPAIFGDSESYKHLRVRNGMEAQEFYLAALANGNLKEVKKYLVEYCDKDVEEMIHLYLFLLKKVAVGFT
jgi:hypothetical protein